VKGMTWLRNAYNLTKAWNCPLQRSRAWSSGRSSAGARDRGVGEQLVRGGFVLVPVEDLGELFDTFSGVDLRATEILARFVSLHADCSAGATDASKTAAFGAPTGQTVEALNAKTPQEAGSVGAQRQNRTADTRIFKRFAERGNYSEREVVEAPAVTDVMLFVMVPLAGAALACGLLCLPLRQSSPTMQATCPINKPQAELSKTPSASSISRSHAASTARRSSRGVAGQPEARMYDATAP
jgi:hypothetical protein